MRIRVYRFSGDGIDEEELERLLEEAECEIVDEGADEEDTLEPLIVILTDEVCADQDLDGVLFDAAHEGRRVVCVWPKGAAQGTSPQAAEKHSSDEIAWDAEHLRRAVAGVGQPYYETPTGSPRQEPDTSRNKC